jgi:gamma-D-glutamyl-L-lysine dipeptidyl-peptidase
MSRATHGVVSLAVLDVRRRPGHGWELTSQFLLGEVVRVLRTRRDGAWSQVEGLTDGYRGWVRNWGFVPVTGARARSWMEKAGTRVAVAAAEVRARPGRSALVSPLFLNSRVIAGRRRGTWRRVELPDGRRGWIAASALAGPGERATLTERVLGLLGVPYHWGGRTPAGFDCSGFTQQVLAEQGVCLPRDAAHQMRSCRRLAAGESPQIGDLIFFGAPGRPVRHVGLGLGGGYFAHCRGIVRIGSVDYHNALWDKGLSGQIRGWWRPRAQTVQPSSAVGGVRESA